MFETNRAVATALLEKSSKLGGSRRMLAAIVVRPIMKKSAGKMRLTRRS